MTTPTFKFTWIPNSTKVYSKDRPTNELDKQPGYIDSNSIEGLAKLFSDSPELIFENLPAAELPVLTEKDYVLDGMTGLLDAIGTVINRMKYAVGRDLKEKNGTVMIVIFTDGGENASRIFKYQEISSSIKELEATGNWNFAFIGADIDAWGAASRLNMQQSRVYSSAKADIKETMHYAANELERSIQSKRSGKNWEGFGEL